MPPSDASAPGSIGKNRPVSRKSSFNCLRVTPASTVDVQILGADPQDPVHLRQIDEMPPLTAATWPSSEVPAPKGMTGVLCSAHKPTIAGNLLGAAREGDGIRGVRRMIGFIPAVLGADRRRGRQPIAEELAQCGQQRLVDGLAAQGGERTSGGLALDLISLGAGLLPTPLSGKSIAAPPAQPICSPRPFRGHIRPQTRARRVVSLPFPGPEPSGVEQRLSQSLRFAQGSGDCGDGDGAGGGHARRQISARSGTGLSDRHPGAGAAADDAAPARRRGGAQHRLLYFRLSRLAAGRARPGIVGGAPLHRKRTASISSRRSTRNWARPRSGAASSSASSRAQNTTASLPCGTPRDRVWTAAATRSSTATPRVRPPMAAFCCWPATITPANPRRCRTNPNTPSWTPASRC